MTGPQVAGESAARRLMRSLDYRLSDAEPLAEAQVAVVLRALADHTAIMAALQYRRDEQTPWPEARSVGRWLHDTADQLERVDRDEQQAGISLRMGSKIVGRIVGQTHTSVDDSLTVTAVITDPDVARLVRSPLTYGEVSLHSDSGLPEFDDVQRLLNERGDVTLPRHSDGSVCRGADHADDEPLTTVDPDGQHG